MTDDNNISYIKSKPLEDDISTCGKEPEAYVEQLEKQLANILTIQEIPALDPVEGPSNPENVEDTSSDLKNSDGIIEELRTSLASVQAELTTMKGKYWTEKLTLESVTKAKWKSSEQVIKQSHEKDVAVLKANFKNAEKNLKGKNDLLNSDVTRLEKDLKQCLSKVVQLEGDLGVTRSSVRVLTDKLMQTETSLEENVQAKNNLEKLLANSRSQCAELLKQEENLKFNAHTNMQILHSLEQKVEQVSLLSLELPALRSQYDATKNKLIKADEKILQLESELMDHKKKALGVSIMKRKLQQTEDNQKNTDSAMAILVQKLANLEYVKEDAEGLKSTLNQLHEERISASNKVKRLKKRLLRKTESIDLLMTKWDKLTLFLRKLEEKAATGELLTRSDFDTVLHFVLNSPFTDVKKEIDDSDLHDKTGETIDGIDDDVTEIVLSPSPGQSKDSIEKVVKRFKAVEITAKHYESSSKSPSQSTMETNHNGKGVVSCRRTTNERTTRSSMTRVRRGKNTSDSRRRRSRSISSDHWYRRKKCLSKSSRRSSSRSLSVETISRSPSPSKEYKRHYRRSRSRSYSRCNKYSRYSPYYRSSHSSSGETSIQRSCLKKNPKESGKSSVERRKEAHLPKQQTGRLNKNVVPETSRLNGQLANIQYPSEMSKRATTGGNGDNSSPEITVIDVEENCGEANDSPLEEGEIEKCLLSPVPDTATITEAEWDALILSPKKTSGVGKLSPALAKVNLTNTNIEEDQLDSLLTQEIQNIHSNLDCNEVSRPSTSVIDTVTSSTCNPGTSRQSPEIVPLYVREIPGQSLTRPPLLPTPSRDFVPLLPPPSPPPFLALELTNAPVIISPNRGKSKPVGKVMFKSFDIGIAERIFPTTNKKHRSHSNYSQRVPFLYTPPPTEDWDAESIDYNSSGGNGSWNGHLSRGNYNNCRNTRIVVPAARSFCHKNKRKFMPYMRGNRATNIPIDLNVRSNIPQQPLPGHSIVDEFMQQYTVSIVKEIPGYSEKHPVEALKDLCISKGWEAPKYTYHADTSKNPRTLEYFCKVFVNNVLHQPKYGSNVKMDAQTIAAIYCLQQLGINP